MEVCLKLHEKCLYSELFWSVFSRIRTEYREIKSKYDQKNSEYGHFLRSVKRSDYIQGFEYISSIHY